MKLLTSAIVLVFLSSSLLAEDKEKALEKQSKELLRYIPIAGKDIYWRFGPGEEKIKEQKLDKLRGKD